MVYFSISMNHLLLLSLFVAEATVSSVSDGASIQQLAEEIHDEDDWIHLLHLEEALM